MKICVSTHMLFMRRKEICIIKRFLFNANFLRSALFNEDFPDRMSFYYGKVEGSDSRDWRNLLLCRNRRLGERPDRLSIDNISATGLPRGDVDRYHSSGISLYGLFIL